MFSRSMHQSRIIYLALKRHRRTMVKLSARENNGTEREAQGVGRDMSCPRKLFLAQRKSRFSGGSLFSETSAFSLASFSGS